MILPKRKIVARSNILPTFLKKGKCWLSHRGHTVGKSNKADCAVMAGSDSWEINSTLNANPQRRLWKSHCVIYRLSVYAAETWTANFTGESPTLTWSWASPFPRTHARYVPTYTPKKKKVLNIRECSMLHSHLHWIICFSANQCYTWYSTGLREKQ